MEILLFFQCFPLFLMKKWFTTGQTKKEKQNDDDYFLWFLSKSEYTVCTLFYF